MLENCRAPQKLCQQPAEHRKHYCAAPAQYVAAWNEREHKQIDTTTLTEESRLRHLQPIGFNFRCKVVQLFNMKSNSALYAAARERTAGRSGRPRGLTGQSELAFMLSVAVNLRPGQHVSPMTTAARSFPWQVERGLRENQACDRRFAAGVRISGPLPLSRAIADQPRGQHQDRSGPNEAFQCQDHAGDLRPPVARHRRIHPPGDRFRDRRAGGLHRVLLWTNCGRMSSRPFKTCRSTTSFTYTS